MELIAREPPHGALGGNLTLDMSIFAKGEAAVEQGFPNILFSSILYKLTQRTTDPRSAISEVLQSIVDI